MAINLEKTIEKEAPALLDLAKKATISLEKHKLFDTILNVGLVLDASGSMSRQYAQGKVQEVINRVLPLAVHFDANNELDVWAFSNNTIQLPKATLSNYSNFIGDAKGDFSRGRMMQGNNEPDVIKNVIKNYKDSKLPAFVIFISDGGVSSDAEISKLLKDASNLPIFWQFVGIGGGNYGVLKRLDTMTGRVVDNCNFFELSDLNEISESELYNRLLTELPSWLEAIKNLPIKKPWYKFW